MRWSVEDTTPDPNGLDPFWDYVFNRKLRPVMSDCCIKSYGVDDFDSYFQWSPVTFGRDSIKALAAGQLFDFSTEPLRMPNITVRLGLYVADTWVWCGGWWPYLQPFDDTELRNGYTDPYGNHYAGYTNHGDYVNKMKAAVNSLVNEGLYESTIGNATVVDEAAHSPYPLPKAKILNTQVGYSGLYSDITNKCYTTIEERQKAEERLAAFFGRGFGKENVWRKAR